MKKRKTRSTTKKRNASRRLALILGIALSILLIIGGAAGEWYVHHSRSWLERHHENWPRLVTYPLLWLGNPLGDFTDALGLTGHDTVYEYDEEAPIGSVTFAGAPRRTALPAPNDIRIIDRGEFLIGWSDSLRHPVWCAYHVTPEKKHEDGKRPSFLIDRAVPKAPRPEAYSKSGYDRGHMVPNHAIISRYGEEARRKTFLMSNIAPQTPALNRGVWRDMEHRIADLWTARYGEIWVVVGAIPSETEECLALDAVDIPSAYFQVVLAQEGLDIRALAVIFPQDISWNAWPTRYLVTIDELEEMTGLDFNPELPSFIQDPLEAELPSRLWPIRFADILKLILLRFS